MFLFWYTFLFRAYNQTDEFPFAVRHNTIEFLYIILFFPYAHFGIGVFRTGKLSLAISLAPNT